MDLQAVAEKSHPDRSEHGEDVQGGEEHGAGDRLQGKGSGVGWEVDGRQEETEPFEDVAELQGDVGACEEEGVGDWLAEMRRGRRGEAGFHEVD